MAESIINRVGRIISGSANALVDAVENASPSMIMEQAVREIDQAIDDVRAELGKVIAGKHLANKRLSEKNTAHEEFASKIELAVSEGRDDLAEAAISAQLDIEAQIPVLEHSISSAGEKEVELEGFISALQAKKREMKEELKLLREAKDEAESSGGAASDSTGTTKNDVNKSIDNATSAFDRVLEKQTGLSGVGGASNENAAKLQELEQFTRDNRVKERLAAIKSKTQNSKKAS
ncbi:MAG: PspA/IM30 family protein [Proteobacteria bacterium]|nr:PspA/IM30 family protein [Pseudomonadota bacterium]MDA0967347.1 PspA/IM30 family protein [Pseudomonadota bacterium]